MDSPLLRRDDADTMEDAPGRPARSLHRLGVHFSSASTEHYTPPAIIEAVIACLGSIDLDPCSNSHHRPRVPARWHFTREDDGLGQPWEGRVFMNPPYGRVIDRWVDKLVNEYRAGRTTAAVALLPGRIDTRWFARLRDFPWCAVRGRLTFLGGANAAPFPSTLHYLGPDAAAFVRSFRVFGDVWQRVISEDDEDARLF